VEVPEWGGSVFIRPLTIHEQAKLADLGTKYEKSSVVERMKNCTMRLVQWSVCDERGPRAPDGEVRERLPAPAGRDPGALGAD